MTDAQFQAWAANPDAIRCVLVEAVANVSGTETTRYLSNIGFVTSGTDTPANTAYTACVQGGVNVSETLPLNGKASLSWGDIEVSNPDGVRDSWLGDVWSGRAVTVRVGDVRWPLSEFRTVFSGVIEDISVRSADTLNLLLRDKSQQLNSTLTEATLANATLTSTTLKPLCFGEVHNITPVLSDAATLTYMVHDGPIEGVIEVRDNGIPVSFGVNLANGTFSLSASPVGTITASVQGAKPSGTYLNTVGPLVKHIATTYGTTPLAVGDLDVAQIDAFSSTHTQAVGVYLSGRTNTINVLQDLASSVGAQVTMSPGGKLQIKKVSLPAGGTPVNIGPSDMVVGTLAVSSVPPVVASVRLEYCRNYTEQKGLQTGLPPAHAELYGQEWLVVQAVNQSVADLWNLTTSPEATPTLLQVRLQAEAEASRRLDLWGVRRKVLKFDAFGAAVTYPLGGAVTLTHSRFGLSAGVTGQVVSKKTDWLGQKVSFEVLV